VSPGNRRLPSRPSWPSQPPIEPERKASVFPKVLHVARTAAGVTLVAAASIGLAWLARRHVLASPRFAIVTIDVTGCVHREPAAVVAESGLAVGQNLLGADLDAARAKLLADPWIAEATIGRRLPGTVSVAVVEHRPVALVAVDDLYLATSDGKLFKRLGAGDPTDLPIVTGLQPGALTEDPRGAERTVSDAIELGAEVAQSDLGGRLALEEIHLQADGTFALIVGRSGIEVQLGKPPFRRKLDQAARVVTEVERRGGKTEAVMLDDERPDRVVARVH
jgi:cell division protein FtsQ